MTKEDFIKLCETETPSKITYDGCDLKIHFNNGLWVEINAASDYDCEVLEFESSIERENEERELNERWRREAEQKKTNEEKIKAIKQKYSPQQWAEIEQVFFSKFI